MPARGLRRSGCDKLDTIAGEDGHVRELRTTIGRELTLDQPVVAQSTSPQNDVVHGLDVTRDESG